MEITEIERDDNVTLIKLIGSLDIEGVQSIQTKFYALTGSQGRPAIVDMSQVDFLASLGLRMLLSSARNLDKAGAKLVLLHPQSLVEASIATAGLEGVLPVAFTEEEALELAGVG